MEWNLRGPASARALLRRSLPTCAFQESALGVLRRYSAGRLTRPQAATGGSFACAFVLSLTGRSSVFGFSSADPPSKGIVEVDPGVPSWRRLNLTLGRRRGATHCDGIEGLTRVERA